MKRTKANTLEIVSTLAAIVGKQNLSHDVNDLAIYSGDLAFDGLFQAVLVVAPGTRDELQKVVREATANSYCVIGRGGGLSYTGGFVPVTPNSVIVDTRRLDRILEINQTDQYVRVETGCTWSKLHQELANSGLRVPNFGPASGGFSTVGGSLSQNSMFFGSANYGSVADHVLGLEVVLADGNNLRTGAGAMKQSPPFFRYHGPDLTGLFLGDCGALGIKSVASFRLINSPICQGFLSLAFPGFSQMLRAQSVIARSGGVAECIGLGDCVPGDSDSSAQLHLVVEANSELEVEKRIDEIRELVGKEKKEIEPEVPRFIREKGFDFLESTLDSAGRLQSWTHGIFPFSRVSMVYEEIKKFLDEKSDLIKQHGITFSITSGVIGNAALIEPVMHWADRPRQQHLVSFGRTIKGAEQAPSNPGATVAVASLRAGLRDLFSRAHAVHFQLGKFYQFKETLDPQSWWLLTEFKKTVDPSNLMNPGALQMGGVDDLFSI